MKRILSLLVVVLMVASLLVACAAPEKEAASAKSEEAAPAKSEEAAPAEETAEPIKIGLNIGKPDREFPQRVENGVRDACEARGWEVIVTYGGDEKIIDNARTLLAQDVDYIFEFGVNAEAGTAATALAAEKDVPVFCIDVQYEGAYFFGANNAEAGTILGESMAEAVEEKFGGELDAIVCFFPEQTGPVVRLRIENAVKAIRDAGITVGDETWYDSFENEKTNQLMSDYLAAHPDMDKIAVLSLAAVSGPGIVSRFEIADRLDHGLVGTHNVSTAYLENMKDEDTIWVTTVNYGPNLYGEYLCKMAEEMIAGNELPATTTMDHVAVTKDNVNDIDFDF